MAVSEALRERVREAWLSRLPAGWTFCRFGDALERVERPIDVSDDVPYRQPVIRRNHGGIELRATQLGCNILTKKQYVVHAGDWLMSKVQIMHRAYGIVPPELGGSIASGSYFVFVPRPNLHLPFFWYLSHLRAFHLTCDLSSVGVVIEKMVFRVDDWLGFQFPLPPLSEQRKIAAILSSVDDTIEATQAVIDQLQVVKSAMMAELLTRGIPGRHTRFKDTEIGLLPQTWELAPLGEVATVERGKFAHRPRNDPRFYGGPYPFVQTGEVAASGGRIRSFSQTLNDEGLRLSRLFPAGTVVLTIAANIGETAIATFPVAFPDSLVGIEAGPRVDNRFLELVLRSRKGALEEAAPQSAQRNINLETLRPLLIQLPPRSEQEEIANGFDAMDARLHVELQLLNLLRSVKSDLMSTLLIGAIRVTPVEREDAA